MSQHRSSLSASTGLPGITTTASPSTSLADLGWDESWRDSFTEYERTHPGSVPARVLRAERGLCQVLTEHGPTAVILQAAHHHGPAGTPTTGDWLAIIPATETGPALLGAVLPRRTALARSNADGSSRAQLLAANVDTVVVTVSLAAPLRHTRTERLLALAWESGARPVVALTKADTHPDPETALADLSDVALGVDVILTSASLDHGTQSLAAVVQGTVVLLGPSGAGKSTLGNRLLGQELLATGDVREVDGKGRHTTAWRELLPLPGGGVLLDTPGLRAIGLTGSDEGLQRTFADVEALALVCRFGDCEHRTEPGCAVLAAILAGTLSERRLESYRKLQRENAWQASRTDARARTARTAQLKSRTRQARSLQKTQGNHSSKDGRR